MHTHGLDHGTLLHTDNVGALIQLGKVVGKATCHHVFAMPFNGMAHHVEYLHLHQTSLGNAHLADVDLAQAQVLNAAQHGRKGLERDGGHAQQHIGVCHNRRTEDGFERALRPADKDTVRRIEAPEGVRRATRHDA